MALGLEDKKYVEVIKNGVTYNVIGVNVVKGGVTYNVWGSGSSVVYVVDTNVAYSEDVLNGDSVLSPKTFTPTKNGYTFVGWRTDRTASSSVLTSKVMDTEPITLFAVFKRTLTLSYNGNGSTSGSVTSQTGTQYYNNGNTADPTFALASNGFSRTGYRFVRWRSGSASGTAYAAGASVTLPADTTFYAEWFDLEITVFTASFTENADNLVFEESGRSMDGNYLSNVMTMLKNGAGYNETNEVNATLLALTDKAKSEYNYVTVTFRAMHYCIYGGSTGTVAGETLYQVSDRGEHFATYTKKLAVTNTNWAVNMKDNNKSDHYGCDNRLAVQSVVMSVS